jgi:hypothetical protein
MAFTGYGAKYTLTFSDVYQNTTGQYIATIYKKGYSGFVNEVSGTGTPLVIETDRDGGNGGYRPVIATKATLNLLFNYVGEGLGTQEWTPNANIWETYQRIFSESGFDIREFITADPDTFLLEVKRKSGGSYEIIWQGYYIYNTDVALNEIAPITFSLQFSDFGLMKINRFYNFPVTDQNLVRYNASDKISLLDVIMRCCYFSYATTAVSIEYPFPYGFDQAYYSTNSTAYSSSTEAQGLASLYILKNAFLEKLGKYQTLYDVLSGVCSEFGLMAFYKKNKLCIRSYDKLVNNESGSISTAEYTVNYYDDTTDKVEYSFTSYSSDDDTIRELNSSLFKNIGRSQNIRFNYPLESVSITNSASLNNNMPNYNMASISQVFKGLYSGEWYSINSWYGSDGNEKIFLASDTTPTGIQARPFYPYASLKTETFGTNFATKFPANRTNGFNINNYIDSEVLSVSSGDIITFSYSAYTDGRLKNLPPTGGTYNQANMRPKPVVALVILADDADGNEVTYYYNSTTNKFESYNTPTSSGSLPLITTTNYLGNDYDWIHYDLKAVLDIPDNAKLKIRQYQPFRGVNYDNIDDIYQLYVEYCNLQSFKNTAVEIPKSQEVKTLYQDLIQSDEDLTLDSNIFIMDVRNYLHPQNLLIEPVQTLKSKNPIYLPSCYGNSIIDKYYMPINRLQSAGLANEAFNYGNPALENYFAYSFLTKKEVEENILRNIGLTNTTIEGTYKSDAIFFIGNKFSYQITGYDNINFALLDYSIDLKNATYDALLYSSQFADDTGKTAATQTITT